MNSIKTMLSMDERLAQMQDELKSLREDRSKTAGKIAELRQRGESKPVKTEKIKTEKQSDDTGDILRMLCILSSAISLLMISAGYFMSSIEIFNKGIAVIYTTAGLLLVFIIYSVIHLFARGAAKRKLKRASKRSTAKSGELSNVCDAKGHSEHEDNVSCLNSEIAELMYDADMLDERIADVEYDISRLKTEFGASNIEYNAALLAQRLILESAEEATAEFLPKFAQ